VSSGSNTREMTALSVAKLLLLGSMLSGSPWSALTVIVWLPPGCALACGCAVGAGCAGVVAAAPAAAGVGTETLLAPPAAPPAAGWPAGPHAATRSARQARVEESFDLKRM